MSTWKRKIQYWGIACLILSLLSSGCSMLTPAKKPEVGPTGDPISAKPNPPFAERFWSPPEELYDLEATAGVIFDGLRTEQWPQVEKGLSTLQTTWLETRLLIGEKKGAKEADEALQKLSASVTEKRAPEVYENLNRFMGSISEIGKSYKLSPLSDIIAVGNAVRNVSFYVEDRNWSKAASKAKELDDTWGQVKPSMEKVGILNEITKTHVSIKQIKDAVNAENKGAFEDQAANINESMGRIREFYRGK
ncbi:MAG: DUF4363 family protein [Veillonellales bacterium]